jgi:serine/threonine-protein kinase
VERTILRCIDKDPAKRPSSAYAVLASLPGDDPLMAALAAGKTPSPEMVVAAGEKSGLHPKSALICLLAIMFATIATAHLNSRFSLIDRIQFELPPTALVVKSREILERLGYPNKPFDRYGLNFDIGYIDYIKEHDSSPDRWRQLENGRGGTLTFWYRQGPSPLSPGGFHWDSFWRVEYESNPPWNVPGMIGLQLDPQGHLRDFRAKPRERLADAGSENYPKIPDWSLIFDLAGFDLSRFSKVPPKWNPNFASDTLAAWTGTPSELEGVPLRIEAAANRGKLVSFKIFYPWSEGINNFDSRIASAERIIQLIDAGVILFATLFAWRNFRLKRGDLRGGFRIAVFVFMCRLLSILFAASHTAGFAEHSLIMATVAKALLSGMSAWLLYLAIEPYVRRRYPTYLIGWNRLIDGKLNDPLVGKEILIGILSSFIIPAVSVLGAYLQSAPPSLSFVGESVPLDTLLGMRFPLAIMSGSLTWIVQALGVLFFLVVLSALLRRKWLAIVLISAIVALPGLAGFGPIAAVANFIQLVLWLFLCSRYGLLTLYSSLFWLVFLTNNLAFTSDLSTWYSESTIMIFGICVAIAFWGFYASMKGQNLVPKSLQE